MAEKLSIPKNYEVKPVGSMVGLIRHGKNGDKWIWEPFYNMLFVAKTYGKILVAYKEATDTRNCLKISSYDKKMTLPIDVYGFMFGENCLYVQVLDNSTNEFGWAYIKEDFSGLKYLGEFKVKNESWSNPLYIPIGTVTVDVVMPDGTEKRLKLISGELTDKPKASSGKAVSDYSIRSDFVRNDIPKPVEEPITEYKVLVNGENNRIQLLGRNNKVLKESLAIGELIQYNELIKAMLGGNEVIPVSTGDLLMEFLTKFEHYVHGMVLPILYTYEKDRAVDSSTLDNRLKDMINELESDWFKWNNKEFKVYIQGTIFLVMMRKKNERICVAPYMLTTENNILVPEEFEALLNVYKLNGYKSTKIRIDNIDLLQSIEDATELSSYQSPYSVRQRLDMSKTIKSHTYKSVDEIAISGHLESDKENNNTGNIEINVSICNDFKYTPKAKSSKTPVSEITTNVSAIQIIY